MVDSSENLIKYRVVASSYYIASDQTRHAMKLVRDQLRDRYQCEPPEHRVIKAWSTKLLETGSLIDKQRSGRLTERGDKVDVAHETVDDEPKSSARRLSNELDIPKSPVHNILKKDLGLRAWN